MDLNQTATYCEQTVGIGDVYQLTKSNGNPPPLAVRLDKALLFRRFVGQV